MIASRPLLCCLLLLCSLPTLADSRCSERPKSLLLPAKISCTHQTTWIDSGVVGARQVIYQTPLGTPPAGGWPVVLVYQGSFFPLDNFTYYSNQPFGGFYEGKLIRTLLDNGYAVVAPSAPADLFWQTNIPGLAQAYELSTDYDFLGNVLAAIAVGHFGPLNPQRQYATGISSGGYNTSRMAVSFPGRFRALAIQSGSYATCSGPLCVVPELPADHPPTTRRPCSCTASSIRWCPGGAWTCTTTACSIRASRQRATPSRWAATSGSPRPPARSSPGSGPTHNAKRFTNWQSATIATGRPAAGPTIVDKDHALQNLRTSDNGGYIDFLRDRLNDLGIEAIACDLGEEARGHRYALLLPHDGDAPRAWQALTEAPSEHDHHLQLGEARDNRLIAFCRSAAVRRASLALLALVLLGSLAEALVQH